MVLTLTEILAPAIGLIFHEETNLRLSILHFIALQKKKQHEMSYYQKFNRTYMHTHTLSHPNTCTLLTVVLEH